MEDGEQRVRALPGKIISKYIFFFSGSAHGEFRELMKNPQLKGLLGSFQSVTLGDQEAKKQNRGSKSKTERVGGPVFDTIIQLVRINFFFSIYEKYRHKLSYFHLYLDTHHKILILPVLQKTFQPKKL